MTSNPRRPLRTAAMIPLLLALVPPAGAQSYAPQAPQVYAPPPSQDYSSARLGIRYQLVPYGGAFGARLTQYPAPGSPAAQLQLEPGDMITSLDNLPIHGPQDVENHVAQTSVVFVNIRTNQPQAGVFFIPGQPGGGGFPPQPGGGGFPPQPPPPPTGNAYVLGVAAVPVAIPGPSTIHGYAPAAPAPTQTALQVTQVTPGSAALFAGVQVGDQLVTANNLPMTNQAMLSQAINASGGVLNLLVRRPSTGQYFNMTANLTPASPIIYGAPATAAATGP